MKVSKMISAIDTHTAGEAARLIIGGIPKFPGDVDTVICLVPLLLSPFMKKRTTELSLWILAAI